MSDDDEPTLIPVDDLILMMDYVRKYADTIFIRHLVGDVNSAKYENVAISKLPTKAAIDFAFKCVERWLAKPGYRPVRVVKDGEGG